MKTLLQTITIMFMLISVAYSQTTSIQLPTKDNASSNFSITNSDGTNLFKLNADGGLLVEGTYGTGAIPKEGSGARMMWYPKKAAFRVGYAPTTHWDDANIGDYSTAFGYSTKAGGVRSVAFGSGASASGDYSIAMGYYTTASGTMATSIGHNTTASGNSSCAMGYYSEAQGDYSTAMGEQTIASGFYSVAMGYRTTASNHYSTAIGNLSTASSTGALAAGYNSTSSGNYSVALGYKCKANDAGAGTGFGGAISLGYETESTGGFGSVAMGYATDATSDGAIAIGWGATASAISSIAIGGLEVVANGVGSISLGNYVSNDGKSGSIIMGGGGGTTGDPTKNHANNEIAMRFLGGYRFYTDDNESVGVIMGPGYNSWQSLSDSTKKENIIEADGEEFLSSISKMKLGSWNYKTQNPKEFRHYGPMAQDIYHYFGNDGVGTVGCDTLLASADMDGIMMIAIKALIKRTEQLKTENAKLVASNKIIEAENKVLKKDKELVAERLSKLEEVVNGLIENKTEFVKFSSK